MKVEDGGWKLDEELDVGVTAINLVLASHKILINYKGKM